MAEHLEPLPMPTPQPGRSRYTLACALGLGHLIRLHLLCFGIGLLLLAASLQWEPGEWSNPIFGIAFTWLRPSWWAVLLVLLATVKLAACITYPRLVPVALVAGVVVFVLWTASFATAYLSREISPTSPMLPLLGAWVVGEHLAVASLMQRDRRAARTPVVPSPP